jgi:predicted nuclease of predicted toxin-antitoxin system
VKLKLDENIGGAGAELLRAAGHDVSTVREQDLQGVDDEVLLEACTVEQRALVTLDRGIGRLLQFWTRKSPGVAVLEIGSPQSHRVLLERLSQLAQLLRNHDLTASFWILEPHRVRMHPPQESG